MNVEEICCSVQWKDTIVIYIRFHLMNVVKINSNLNNNYSFHVLIFHLLKITLLINFKLFYKYILKFQLINYCFHPL